MEKSLVSLSHSYGPNIWVDDEVFGVVVSESCVGFTEVPVGSLFPKFCQHSVSFHISLIVEEVLDVGPCYGYAVFITPVF